MSSKTWWLGLPLWLKLVYLLVAIPAWTFMVFCVATEQGKSTAALLAFGIFFGVALLNVAFDRRNRGTQRDVTSGIDIGE